MAAKIMGIVQDQNEYRTKFKIKQALWNPRLDVLALASSEGEICLKRYYWKTGWKKKLASESVFYTRWNRTQAYGNAKEDVGEFVCMCWSPCGNVLAVAFESNVCHMVDVNDALILYSLRTQQEPKSMHWIDLQPLTDNEASNSNENSLLTNETTFNSTTCDHLRTKDSDTYRDNYKMVLGLQEFCHRAVHKSLRNTALIVVGARNGIFGFNLYMSGIFLCKSGSFVESLLPENYDRMSFTVRDCVILPNANLQFAISVLVLGKPRFDETAGFKMSAKEEVTSGESTYLIEYDVGFNNRRWIASSCHLASRLCHIFHLLTGFRENFLKTCTDWDSVSGQFHSNVFGKLHSKYLEEKEDVSDFALDFMCYILTGNSLDAFASAFFKEIRPSDWKPARDFVLKHIPNFLQSINRHLIPLVDMLYVHLHAFQGELLVYERSAFCCWDESKYRFRFLNQVSGEAEPIIIKQIKNTIAAVQHLSHILQILSNVSHRNWAELKYVLQLLSSHPDNEQLEMDIEDDFGGLPREIDFKMLLKFVLDALIDPEKHKLFEDSTTLMHIWQSKLAGKENQSKMSDTLVCNPNWLKHRVFDKIGPLLGVCADIPVMQLRKGLNDITINQENLAFDCDRATTVLDALKLCFNTMEDMYLTGTRGLCGNDHDIQPTRVICLEFCHPVPITKLCLVNWERLKESAPWVMPCEVKKCQEVLESFEKSVESVCQSLVVVHRASSATLQLYATVSNATLPFDVAALCAPRDLAKVVEMGSANKLSDCNLSENVDKKALDVTFMQKKYQVLNVDVYGTAALHLICVFGPESGSSVLPAYLVRSDIRGNFQRIEPTPITYNPQPVLMTAPKRAVCIIFESNYELVHWLDLEEGVATEKGFRNCTPTQRAVTRRQASVSNRREPMSLRTANSNGRNRTLSFTDTPNQNRLPSGRLSIMSRHRRLKRLTRGVCGMASDLPADTSLDLGSGGDDFSDNGEMDDGPVTIVSGALLVEVDVDRTPSPSVSQPSPHTPVRNRGCREIVDEDDDIGDRNSDEEMDVAVNESDEPNSSLQSMEQNHSRPIMMRDFGDLSGFVDTISPMSNELRVALDGTSPLANNESVTMASSSSSSSGNPSSLQYSPIIPNTLNTSMLIVDDEEEESVIFNNQTHVTSLNRTNHDDVSVNLNRTLQAAEAELNTSDDEQETFFDTVSSPSNSFHSQPTTNQPETSSQPQNVNETQQQDNMTPTRSSRRRSCRK